MLKQHIIFYRRGQIEVVCKQYRKKGYRYRWTDGYSENAENGSVCYPWKTYRECQRQANKENKIAKFVK